MSDKPVKPKPHFYAACLSTLQPIAREHGYNLLIHGSINRDMDLVAVPWIDEPKTHAELLKAFCNALGAMYLTDQNGKPCDHTVLPGGRDSYIIQLNRGMKWNNWQDEEWYIDISITPLIVNK